MGNPTASNCTVFSALYLPSSSHPCPIHVHMECTAVVLALSTTPRQPAKCRAGAGGSTSTDLKAAVSHGSCCVEYAVPARTYLLVHTCSPLAILRGMGAVWLGGWPRGIDARVRVDRLSSH